MRKGQEETKNRIRGLSKAHPHNMSTLVKQVQILYAVFILIIGNWPPSWYRRLRKIPHGGILLLPGLHVRGQHHTGPPRAGGTEALRQGFNFPPTLKPVPT